MALETHSLISMLECFLLIYIGTCIDCFDLVSKLFPQSYNVDVNCIDTKSYVSDYFGKHNYYRDMFIANKTIDALTNFHIKDFA